MSREGIRRKLSYQYKEYFPTELFFREWELLPQKYLTETSQVWGTDNDAEEIQASSEFT